MSRFNIRQISAPVVAAPAPVADKKPSAYSAMKHGTSIPMMNTITMIPAEEETKKKGRPSKDDIRKHKLAMASDQIAVLVESKPTRNKIRDFLSSRITQLDDEKR
jgi:hypothetical protein